MYTRIRYTIVVSVVLVAFGGLLQTAAAQTEVNKATVQRFVEEGLNEQNMDVIDELMAVDVVFHEPTVGDLQGREGFKAMLSKYFAAFSDLQWPVEDLIAEADRVVVRSTASLTHTGDFMGLPATGIQAQVTGNVLWRLADGKLVEGWEVSDNLGLMQQLGMMPATREDYTWGTPSTVTGDPGDPEGNKALLQRFVEEIMNQQDLDLTDELFAADYVMHTAMSPVEVRGPEGLKQMLAMYAIAFPDAQVTIEDTVAEEDQVAFRFTLTGTHNGELMGIPPTGRQVTITGISVHRFADGKFAETWASDDVLGMMEQLTAEEWPLEGPWIVTVPTPMGNMIIKSIWTAQDAVQTKLTGEFEQINFLPLLIDFYPDSERIKFAGALAVKTGPNQYDMTAIEYFTKTVGLSHEEVVGLGVVTGNFEFTGPDSGQGQGTGAYYLARQDADQDGLPDEGQEPSLCVPWTWTAKRLTMMPSCVPTPLSEQAGE